MHRYQVQDGKGKSSYQVRYSFDTLSQAERWYAGINTHSGYKKRIVDTSTGKVVNRYISY